MRDVSKEKKITKDFLNYLGVNPPPFELSTTVISVNAWSLKRSVFRPTR